MELKTPCVLVNGVECIPMRMPEPGKLLRTTRDGKTRIIDVADLRMIEVRAHIQKNAAMAACEALIKIAESGELWK